MNKNKSLHTGFSKTNDLLHDLSLNAPFCIIPRPFCISEYDVKIDLKKKHPQMHHSFTNEHVRAYNLGTRVQIQNHATQPT